MALTFDELRVANIERQPVFKNAKGELAHCETWGLAQWSNATLGELGEAANLIKKIERGDFTVDEVRQHLGGEFGDVLSYLDLLAYAAGIDLGEAVLQKWNEVSERIGYEGRLGAPRTHVAIDGTVRQNHYGAGRQPFDDIKDAGWAPQFAAGNVLKYLRRNKQPEHSLESARWYYNELSKLADRDREARKVLLQLDRELTGAERRSVSTEVVSK